MSIFGQGQLHKQERNRISYRPNAVQNYFEGYELKEVPTDDGSGTEVLRVYTGDYHIFSGTKKQWICRKILVVGLSAAAVALFLVSACLPSPGNLWSVFNASAVVSACAFLYLVYVLISYLPAPRQMTVGVFRTVSKPLKRACILLSLALAASLGIRVYAAFTIPQDLALGLLSAAGMIAALCCVVAIWCMERRAVYTKQPSSEK